MDKRRSRAYSNNRGGEGATEEPPEPAPPVDKYRNFRLPPEERTQQQVEEMVTSVAGLSFLSSLSNEGRVISPPPLRCYAAIIKPVVVVICFVASSLPYINRN